MQAQTAGLAHVGGSASLLRQKSRLDRAPKRSRQEHRDPQVQAKPVQRQGGEQSKVSRLGVHSRSRLERGSD